jgi:hypothetical protein
MAERKQKSPPQEPRQTNLSSDPMSNPRQTTEPKESMSSPKQTPSQSMESIIQDINQNKNKYTYDVEENIQTDYLDPQECINIINKYATLHDVPFDLALAGITKLIQNGGTNQSKQNLIVKVNNKEFELNKLRSLLQSYNKALTVRKFAKGARKLIISISLNNKWSGPLTKELSRINPNLNITPELAPWCNEIHSDNYECPNEIRDALVRREEQLKILFNAGNKINQKPRKLRGKNKKNKK